MALRKATPQFAQLLQLLPALDAFGDDGNPKVACHGDDGPDDGQVAGIRAQVAHKAAVDLDRIHRPVLQVRQTGVPGAEVIDADVDAEVAKLGDGVFVELPVAAFAALENGTLGELDVQELGLEAVLLRQLHDGAGQVRTLQLRGG